MSDVIAQLESINWKFATADGNARIALEERIAATGRNAGLITYSDLVAGVSFKLPTVNGGVAFQVDTSDWRDIDRAILGEYLGLISADSFCKAGFFATALVVSKEDRQPSRQFFKWMRSLGLIKKSGASAETDFWVAEVTKAHAWYSATDAT